MSDHCLHCALVKAAKKWFESHNASTDDIIKMVGRFTAEAISGCPEHRGQEIEIHIFGIAYSNRETLH